MNDSNIQSRSLGFFSFIRLQKQHIIALIASSSVLILLGYASLILRMHYSTDSYHLIDNQQAYWYLQNGRYTWWQLTMWLDQAGINLVLDQRPLLVLAVISFIFSLFSLTFIFAFKANLSTLPSLLIVNLALSLLFNNVFVEEFMLFPEVAVSAAVGFLFTTLAAGLIMVSNRWQNVIGSLVCLLIAIGCYQSLLGYYLALVLIGGCLHTISSESGHPIRDVMARWVSALAIAGATGVFNILIVKILIKQGVIVDPGRGATTNIHVMMVNLVSLLKYQLKLWWNADGLMFPGMMTLLLIIVIGSIALAILMKTNISSCELICAVALSYAAAFIVHVLERDIQLTPRSNMAFWAVQGCLLATLWCSILSSTNNAGNRPIENQRIVNYTSDSANSIFSQSIPKYALTSLIAVFVILTSISMQDISYDLYTSNALDKDYALNVSTKIKDYEKMTGNRIDKIAIREDSKPQEKYRSTRYYNNQLGRRIMNVDYANYQMINYLGGLNLQSTKFSDSVYNKYFKNKNWDTENLEQQLIFIKDTAYLVLY